LGVSDADAHPLPEIPKETEILITRGPAQGGTDRTLTRVHAGESDLLAAVREGVHRLHVFGHIYEARGVEEIKGLDGEVVTVCVNASSLDFKPTDNFRRLPYLRFVIVIHLKDEI
jgi:Icc-related predicted phosphoesterase